MVIAEPPSTPPLVVAGRCPDEETLAAFIAGDREIADAIEQHLDVCPECAKTVALYVGAFEDAAPSDPLTKERFAGRYQILECVGFGAGGTVYRAHDPELDRTVALKVLRAADGGSTESDGRWRREAKVMARVVHPNVVTVHDVGFANDHVFIATEFVDGDTLAKWRAETSPSWKVVLDVFLQAGRGLAAIHDCGLVHRDFKPSNVMVAFGARTGGSIDDRNAVRVTDFGLARLLPELEDYDDTSTAETFGPGTMLADTLVSRTRTGTMVGTPAYMSPEQWRGESATARSDQFSFCVALYEALWGCRPFRGRSAAELSEDVCHGTPRTPPRSKVPRWLDKIVLRGLCRDPADRHADMTELLVALTETPRRLVRRRRIAALVVGSFGVAAIGYGMASFDGPRCEVDEARFAGAWDAPAKAAIGDHLGESTTAAVVDALDVWVARWREISESACRGASVEDRLSPRQYQLQLACLDRRLSQLRAVSSVLGSGEVEDGGAVDVVGTLSSPGKCADLSALEVAEPAWESPESRLLALSLSGDLDKVEALRAAGKLDMARELAVDVVARADQSDDPAVRAEALVKLGEVQSSSKQPGAAAETLRDAVWAAEASGHVEMAAAGWIELVNVYGAQQEDYELAEEAAQRAAAVVHRLKDPGREVALASNRGVLASLQGHYEEALQQHRIVIERAREVYGEDDIQIARMHINLAAVLSHLGRIDEALQEAQAAVAIQATRFPGPHPTTAEMLNTVGALHLQRGDKMGSREAFERALAMVEETLPSVSVTRAMLLSNLAQVDQAEKKLAEAAARYQEVIAIYEEIHGNEHPDVALALHNYASVVDDQGDKKRAAELYRESLALRLRTNGPAHPSTANTQHNLGLCLFGDGQIDEGIELMEAARETRESTAVDPFRRATSHFMLARAYDKRGDHQKALEYARTALGYMTTIAPRRADIRDHIAAWIDEHDAE